MIPEIDRFPVPERYQTHGEEIANSVSHGIGFLAALIAAPCLLVHAARHGGPGAVVGASFFGGTVLFLYLASTLYHAMPRGRAKDIFNIIEHGAIYLLIAGTYTPVTFRVFHGVWTWLFLGLVWGLAVLGVTFKSIGGLKHPRISTGLYLALGWVVIIAIRPVWMGLPRWGFWGVVAGGLSYTLGIPFYAANWRYSHLIWHLFVLIGTVIHFLTVYYFMV